MAKLSLAALGQMDGFMVAALVDSSSGLALATLGSGIDLDLAAAGNTEVLKAKVRVAKALKLNDEVEDLLITLGQQYHLIRPLESNKEMFLYVVLERKRANLAMARHELKRFEKELDFS